MNRLAADEHGGHDNLITQDKVIDDQVMAVNLPALFAVIEKTESIASLVKFFADSPLDGLKDPNS